MYVSRALRDLPANRGAGPAAPNVVNATSAGSDGCCAPCSGRTEHRIG